MSPTPSPRVPNPRGGDRRGQRSLPQRPSSTLWYGLALLLVLGLVQLYYSTPAGRSIPYSEFKTLLKNDQLAEITVSDQTLRGTLKEPAAEDPKHSKEFTTARVEDPKLTEELEAHGVKYTGELAT